MAGGTEVTINGVVEGSLFAAGQVVTVNGQVEGSVYAGGSQVILGPSARVGRNVYAAGYGVKTERNAYVERDLLVAGYQALLTGEVGRDVRAGVGALELSGVVGNDVLVDVGAPGEGMGMMPFTPPGAPPRVAPGLRISRDATIGGKLTYTSAVEQEGSILASPKGGVVYQTPVPAEGAPAEAGREPRPGQPFLGLLLTWVLGRLRELATLLVLGALAVSLIPQLLDEVSERVRRGPLPSLGWGFLTVLVGYVGAFVVGVLLFVAGILVAIATLGGLAGIVFGVGFSALGLLVVAFSVLVQYGSKLVVALMVGDLILRGGEANRRMERIVAGLIGIALYVLLRGIAVLGWLVGLGVTLLGVGAMFLRYRDWRASLSAEARGA